VEAQFQEMHSKRKIDLTGYAHELMGAIW
jgi:hypothetical protein